MKLTKRTLMPASVLCGALGLAIGATGLGPVAFAQSDMRGQASVQAAFTQQDLDRMLAPIALYPDELLSQVLMAATYPLEVVEAARWSRGHPGLDGDAAVRAAASQDWDPSVQSMVAFPQVLSMMDEKLDWTEDLGNAFLAQEPHVMDTIQMLRDRAQSAGNLHSNDQVRVEHQGNSWLIASASSEMVYVPYYDPTVIYGRWWWPVAPVYWRPWPGYYARSGVRVGFYFGNGVTLSPGYFFGRFDWTRRNVSVVYVNNYYDTVVVRNGRPVRRFLADAREYNRPVQWRHNPEHRGSVPYRSPEVRRQFASAPAQRQFEQRREEARREQARSGQFALSTNRAPQESSPRYAERRDARGEDRRETRDESRRDAARAEQPRERTAAQPIVRPGSATAPSDQERMDQRRADRMQGERRGRQDTDANAQPRRFNDQAGAGFNFGARSRGEARITPPAAAPAAAAPVTPPPAVAARPPQNRPDVQRAEPSGGFANRGGERRAERQRVTQAAPAAAAAPTAAAHPAAAPARAEARAERRNEAREERRESRRNDQAARPDNASRSAQGGPREGRPASDAQRNPGGPS